MRKLFSIIVITFALGFFFVTPKLVDASFEITESITLNAIPGTSNGTVLLTWNNPSIVNNYNVVYGESPGQYVYGATNVGRRSNFTVKDLTPGKTYYFALSPVITGTAYGYTNEISSVAATSGTVSSEIEVQVAAVDAVISSADSGPSNAPWYLHGQSGPSAGQVTLYWQNETPADGFDVVYGDFADGELRYGSQNVGDVSSYTVGGLNSGQYYFFSILPEKDDTVYKEYYANPIVVMSR